ncbi:prepilin peptidase [Corynebacterium qintianiae]|uniref:Prepilin peptidase n=1 Tax=Corynebacterium qintianiae TaxID=2709392 RepID=A0A7T0KKK2_9CORY|nr:prepilin peptidase [Corynebacterium qintianiae]QPK82448.1 prepilin peptidase [Corynebacterium qintianiae]
MLIGGLAALGWSAALVYYDVTRLRLPDWLTLPAVCLASAAILAWPVGLWGLAWPAAYLASGKGVGGGDVKLALPLGVVCAAVGGAGAVVAVVLLSSLFTLLGALVTRRAVLAHGPSMLVAAWLVALYGLCGPDL